MDMNAENRPALEQVTGKFQSLISQSLDEAFSRLQPEINRFMGDITGSAVEATRGAVLRVSQKAKENPWYIIGGAAVLLAMASLFVGFRRPNGQDRSSIVYH